MPLPRLRMYEVELLKLEPCPDCGNKITHHSTGTTIAGTHIFTDDTGRKHDHDNNRKDMHSRCECGYTRSTSFKMKCNVQDCDW